MRSRFAARVRPQHAAIGVAVLGTSLSATALALAEATPDEPSLRPPAPLVQDARLRFDQRARVEGRLAPDAAGAQVVLELRPRGLRWRPLATTTVAADGRYRFSTRLRSSGALRVSLHPTATTDGAVAAASGPPSASRTVVVAARVATHASDRNVQAGDVVHVRGTLLPRWSGRRVAVEAGANGHWHVLARVRTRAHGRFDARVVAQALGSERLRVRFAGDERNAGVRARAGELQTFRATLASWYALYGGRTACGGTLGYETLGVANKTLPCGTLVTLRYRGRELTVPVIDRGPYAGGREWDLTGATARRLGFGGAGVIWSTR